MTPEQEKYRKQLLGKKYKPKTERKKSVRFKETIEIPPYSFWTPAWQTKIWYLNNCIFWLNKLTNEGAGPVSDPRRLNEVITALQEHCVEMKRLLNSEQNAQASVASKAQ